MAAIFNNLSKQCPRRIDIINFLPYAVNFLSLRSEDINYPHCATRVQAKTSSKNWKHFEAITSETVCSSGWNLLLTRTELSGTGPLRGSRGANIVTGLSRQCDGCIGSVTGSQSCRGVESRHTLCARKLPTDSIFTPHNKIRESRRSPVRTSYWKLIAKAKSIVRRL